MNPLSANAEATNFVNNADNNKRFNNSNRGYTKGEYFVIGLTILITIFGIVLRLIRIAREGMPIGFDGYYYLRFLKRDFFQGWIDLTALTRDPPGFTFIIMMAEHLFGYSGAPMMWSIFIFPQILSSLQLIVFYVLARRLNKSRMTGLLAMFYMTILGMIVYRNQNIAPETFVLGLVPFVVFYILRYLETNDIRFLILGFLVTFGIVLIHHLTTLIIMVIWHILLPYDILYRRFSKNNNKITKKTIIIDTSILIIMDVMIILFWQFVLKGFPMIFISNSIENLFAGGTTTTTIIMIIAVLVINAIAFSIFFYNFDRKRINSIIVASGVIGVIVMFIVAMFFGGSSPDQSLKSAILMGTHALVLAPLGAIGLVSLPKKNLVRSRMSRGWLFAIIFIISITAIFPIMSSLLGRLALYIASIGTLLATFAIVRIVGMVNIRKLKAITLIFLCGFMALTLSYSHPKPENNWDTQEIFYDAEFATADFLIFYSKVPEHNIWNNSWQIKVDCDFRLAGIIEGYAGMDTIYENSGTSWLKTILSLNETERIQYVSSVDPYLENYKIKYIIINDVIQDIGFMRGWAVYGDDNDDWIKKFPNISELIPLNPFIHRIYDTKITILLLPL